MTAIFFLIVSGSGQGAESVGEAATVISGNPGSEGVPPSPNRAILGLQCRDIQPTDLGGNGITSLQGALVVELMPNGPASSAGIQLGDVVVIVGGRAVNTCTDLVKNMGLFEPGEDLQLTVLHQGHPRDFSVRPMAQGSSAITTQHVVPGTNPISNTAPLTMPATSLNMYQGGGFSLSIPANWTATISRSGFTTYFSAPDGRREFEENGMTVLLGVIVGFSSTESTDLSRLAMKQEQEFKANNPGLQIMERRSTVLAGLPAELMVLENPSANGGRGERSWLVLTIVNDQACIITATSPLAYFSYLQNLFGQIISSIRFSNY